MQPSGNFNAALASAHRNDNEMDAEQYALWGRAVDPSTGQQYQLPNGNQSNPSKQSSLGGANFDLNTLESMIAEDKQKEKEFYNKALGGGKGAADTSRFYQPTPNSVHATPMNPHASAQPIRSHLATPQSMSAQSRIQGGGASPQSASAKGSPHWSEHASASPLGTTSKAASVHWSDHSGAVGHGNRTTKGGTPVPHWSDHSGAAAVAAGQQHTTHHAQSHRAQQLAQQHAQQNNVPPSPNSDDKSFFGATWADYAAQQHAAGQQNGAPNVSSKGGLLKGGMSSSPGLSSPLNNNSGHGMSNHSAQDTHKNFATSGNLELEARVAALEAWVVKASTEGIGGSGGAMGMNANLVGIMRNGRADEAEQHAAKNDPHPSFNPFPHMRLFQQKVNDMIDLKLDLFEQHVLRYKLRACVEEFLTKREEIRNSLNGIDGIHDSKSYHAGVTPNWLREDIETKKKRYMGGEGSGDISEDIMNSISTDTEKMSKRRSDVMGLQIGMRDDNPNGDDEYSPYTLDKTKSRLIKERSSVLGGSNEVLNSLALGGGQGGGDGYTHYST